MAGPTTVYLNVPDVHPSVWEVSFPFTPYENQELYMSRVIQALVRGEHALLESPTGTGKTLCLLCACLAYRQWVQQEIAAATAAGGSSIDPLTGQPRETPLIVYSSRTHSQLSQVMNELKRTEYKPKAALLGSRKQMCVHARVKLLDGAAQQAACRQAIQSRECRHHEKTEHYFDTNSKQLFEKVMDIEDLGRDALSRGDMAHCPYFLTRHMAQDAEILFLPYNYLVSNESRQGLPKNIPWGRAIMIFDEAHNLESSCLDSASVDIPGKLIANCVEELETCINEAETFKENFGHDGSFEGPDSEAVRYVKNWLLDIEEDVSQLVTKEGVTKPGAFMFELLVRNLKGVNDAESQGEVMHEMMKVIRDVIKFMMGDAAESGRQQGTRKHHYHLTNLERSLNIILASQGLDGLDGKSRAEDYRVHIHLANQWKTQGKPEQVLSYWCFRPGVAIQMLKQHLGFRNILLTSGTLSPLTTLECELGLPFDVKLENTHVITPQQIWVGAVTIGPSGTALNSSFRTRDTVQYKQDLGNTVANFARIIPDGVLVFFPSYTVMNSCLDHWKASGVMQRIAKWKAVVEEPRDSALFSSAIQNFAANLDMPGSSGAIFFAVCRGKLSEGLDFADRAGRAVILTGIPYAQRVDPKVRLKREFMDESTRIARASHGHTTRASHPRAEPGVPTLSGDQWYVQTAMRAVNQAVGRVIRHKHDYGAIILADERFASRNVHDQMSLWLRPYIKNYPKFGAAQSDLIAFFKAQARANQDRPVAPVRMGRLPDSTTGPSGMAGSVGDSSSWDDNNRMKVAAIDTMGAFGIPALDPATLDCSTGSALPSSVTAAKPLNLHSMLHASASAGTSTVRASSAGSKTLAAMLSAARAALAPAHPDPVPLAVHTTHAAAAAVYPYPAAAAAAPAAATPSTSAAGKRPHDRAPSPQQGQPKAPRPTTPAALPPNQAPNPKDLSQLMKSSCTPDQIEQFKKGAKLFKERHITVVEFLERLHKVFAGPHRAALLEGTQQILQLNEKERTAWCTHLKRLGEDGNNRGVAARTPVVGGTGAPSSGLGWRANAGGGGGGAQMSARHKALLGGGPSQPPSHRHPPPPGGGSGLFGGGGRFTSGHLPTRSAQVSKPRPEKVQIEKVQISYEDDFDMLGAPKPTAGGSVRRKS